MELVRHAGELLKLGTIRAELTFCAPVEAPAGADRKEIAAQCWKAVAAVAQPTGVNGKID
jgi:hypothetical protein